MKIELKSIKYANIASKETACYSATLWVDDAIIGHVSNDGHGGCDNFYGDQKALTAADLRCRANLPARKYTKEKDGFDATHQKDSESVCVDLLEDHLTAKDLAKVLGSKTLFHVSGTQGLFTQAYKGKVKPDQSLFDSVLAAHPGAVILNTLPCDEAHKKI
jgi:hypothetical protein